MAAISSSSSSPFLLLVIFTISTTFLFSTLDASAGVTNFDWITTSATPKTFSTCQGSIANCSGVDEFDLNSETNRRILATTQYISYASLLRNSVPCSLRGASYYNCQESAVVNPYTRGCSAITQCRS